MSREVEILSTRPVEDELIRLAREKNINLHAIPFIKTEPVESIVIQQEVEQALLLKTSVVFTSMNAVEAVNNFITDEIVQWDIYCIGHATKDLVEKYFTGSVIAGIADNAEELAQLIIEENLSEDIIFFCGDQRRDDLPEALREAGIDVTEVIVYETVYMPRKIVKHYDAILFFSPSAVNSFFSVNTIAGDTFVFAIGSTTGETVKEFCSNKIIIAGEPSKRALVNEAIEYFT